MPGKGIDYVELCPWSPAPTWPVFSETVIHLSNGKASDLTVRNVRPAAHPAVCQQALWCSFVCLFFSDDGMSAKQSLFCSCPQ